MKIQGIEIQQDELNQWAEKLTEAFLDKQKGKDQKGHKYLFIDPKGHLLSFFVDEQLPLGLFKLSIDDIMMISRQKLDHSQHCKPHELKIISKCSTIMRQGAQNSLWSCFVHWWRGLGFASTQTLLEFDMIRRPNDLWVLKKQHQLSDLKEDIDVLLSDFSLYLPLIKNRPGPLDQVLISLYKAFSFSPSLNPLDSDPFLDRGKNLVQQKKRIKNDLEKLVDIARTYNDICHWMNHLEDIQECIDRQDSEVLTEVNNKQANMIKAGYQNWPAFYKFFTEKKNDYVAFMSQISESQVISKHTEIMAKMEECGKEFQKLYHIWY
jgi:hypothetical protein